VAESRSRPAREQPAIWWPAVPSVLVRVSTALAEWPPSRVAALCAVLLAASFAGDVLTGAELSWSIFYIIPVAIAAWHLDWHPTLVVVAAAAVLWLLADVVSGAVYTAPATQYWNAAVRASFFLLVAYMLALLQHALRHERELARTDWLTALPNTRSFLESAGHEIARSRRSGTPLTLAYLDLDGFKAVNDTLGHAAGDDLLRQVAHALRSGLRDVDLVARMGGDEFAVLLPDTDADAASHVLERLHRAMTDLADADAWPVRFSMGAVTSTGADSVDALIRQADVAMYEAKRRGGSQTCHEVVAA
jgi:diguanylate cyclase (GGDEF)-like protein